MHKQFKVQFILSVDNENKSIDLGTKYYEKLTIKPRVMLKT
jgi:hypothetical protein